MLDFVVIDGQRASIGEHAHLFPGYFSTDSMSLMLGENGSGKTRLLQNLAEILTAGASLGDQGHWATRDQHGRVQMRDAKEPPPSLGVVYYTPLHFQRSIRSHRNFVNASKLKAASLKQSMLTNFSAVAQSLGVSTELMASLSYQQSIFERLVIPTLLEMKGNILDDSMNVDLQEYAEYRKQGPSSGKESRTKAFSQHLQWWIESTLDQRHGPLYRIAALATLEELSREQKHRLIVTMAILDKLELANFEYYSSINSSEFTDAIENFNRALNSSLSILTNRNNLPLQQFSDTAEVQFVVDGVMLLQEIEGSGSSFKLSWSNLSSGLLSLVDQFARLEVSLSRLASRNLRSVLILIDEGDSYLHLDWQRQYVEKLDQFLSSAKNRFGFNEIQTILATHSPIISGDFPSALIQRIGSEMDQDIKTFANSLDALVLDAFGTPSIGSKAAREVVRLRTRFLQGILTDEDHYLISEIGDERLQRAVLAQRDTLNDH
ncbi:AAA family ATPase [Chromobacterium paludis]|uniref:AAA family ATPase n=1 Tax=Chromobacterium paludis TaxID=2605945 RepID=UPI00143D3511|nr:AAA family ATPase [Chromobacterium paludis]